ncbi:MAG: HlyC/CorC family transporter [Firmicutes bacterium]|nr:HlyC/CorC family transporter [Bacillota bacterium]
MESDLIVKIIAIIVLVICSACFSASETAFTSLNRIRIKNMAADGNKRARMVLGLVDDYDKLLTTILIGNNIVNIVMTAVATVLFIDLYGRYGATVATVVITAVVLIFGEISPKSLAKESAEKFALTIAPLIRAFTVILTPVNFVFTGWKKLLTKIFRLENTQNFTEDELITIVEEAETEGSIDNEQSELIQNAIEFNDLTAEEVMTPRVDITAVDLEDYKEEEVAELFRKTGYSRVPVYEHDLDNIVGIINQKDFHNYIAGTGRDISDIIKPVVFVVESMKISQLLRKMQQIKTHIAVIVDEYGGTEGIVTMEDIVEELVGEIYDEHDAVVSQEIIPLQNGSYRVMGSANMSKILDYFGIDEELDVVTANGWAAMCLDKIPEVGDRFEEKFGNMLLKGRITRGGERKATEMNLIVEELDDEEE